MKTYIPENIGFLIKKTGYTQDEFGAIFGLNKSLINHYLAGNGNPKLLTVLKICSHFEILIDDFVYILLAEKSVGDHILSFRSDCDVLLKQSQQIASMEEEIERLNKTILDLRNRK